MSRKETNIADTVNLEQGSQNCGPPKNIGQLKYLALRPFTLLSAVEILYYLSCGPRTSSYN